MKSLLGVCGFLALTALALVASPDGAQAQNLVWMRLYNGPRGANDAGNGVAVASDGSVYAAGYTQGWIQGYDLLLQKYSPAGVLVWTRTFDGGVSGDDVGAGVAVATDGSVYVAGSTQVPGAAYTAELLLQKYAAAGTLLWTRTYEGTPSSGNGVAVAPDGSVYVAGSIDVPGTWDHTDMLLQKYSPAGAPLWTRTYRRNAISKGDCGKGVSVGRDGSIFVTGYAEVGDIQSELVLRKYSSAGRVLWMRTYGDAYAARGAGVSVARDGSVYVAGHTFPAYKVLLRKYSASGVLKWMQLYNGPTGVDVGNAVTAAPDGSVYVTGYTEVVGKGTPLLLRKYSAAGRLLWMRTFTGPRQQSNGNGVAVARDGSAYVAGYTYVLGESLNFLLRKYR